MRKQNDLNIFTKKIAIISLARPGLLRHWKKSNCQPIQSVLSSFVSLYNHFNRREGIRVSGLLLRSIHVLRVYFGSLKTSCVKYSVSLLIAVNVLKRMCDAQMKVAWRLPELIETHLDTEWKGWHFTQVFQIRFRCLSRAYEICKLD